MSDQQEKNVFSAEEYNVSLRLFKSPPEKTLDGEEEIKPLFYTKEDIEKYWEKRNRAPQFSQFEINKDRIGKQFIQPEFSGQLLNEFGERQARNFQSWMGDAPYVRQIFTTESRLIIGMGIGSAFENHIQLHHLYGFPYLPASSIKGMVRSWTIFRYYNAKEEKALKDPGFRYLFGDCHEDSEETSGRGHARFGDAFPVANVVIAPDLINVHYPSYYNQGKLPTDTDNPIVIPFLMVETGARFQFLFGIHQPEKLKGALVKQLKGILKAEAENPLQITKHLLAEALEEWGIGAKTSLGMGRMAVWNDETSKI